MLTVTPQKDVRTQIVEYLLIKLGSLIFRKLPQLPDLPNRQCRTLGSSYRGLMLLLYFLGESVLFPSDCVSRFSVDFSVLSYGFERFDPSKHLFLLSCRPTNPLLHTKHPLV